MKRVLVLSLLALSLVAMGKKPQGTVLWTGAVKEGPFEWFEITEMDGKQELVLTKGKNVCRFPLGTFTKRADRADFDGARMGPCKVMEALRASGGVSEKGGQIRLLGGKDPVDLVLVDVMKGK